MKTNIENETESETDYGMLQVMWTFALAMIIYFASVGPAYRLCLDQVLPRSSLNIYKPIVSVNSPLFPITFRYVVLWM